MIIERTSKILVLLCVGLFVTATAYGQTTIYDHQFGGGAVPLNGVAEDFSSTLWSANSFALANGTINGADEGSAILPVSLALGNLYSLELTVNVVSGVDRWVGLGLTDSATLSTPGGSSANDRFSNNGGRGWMLIRDSANAPQDVEFFAGANTTGPVNEATDAFGMDYTADGGGAFNLRIEYDTSPGLAGSLANFYINDVLVVDDMLVNLSGANSVGFSYDNATTTPPSVDNFLFTVTNIGALNQWDVNGGGSFHDAGNWTVSVPGAGQTAVFGGILTPANSPATVTLTSPVSLNDIVFNNGAADYILDGAATLTLTGNPDVDVNAGRHWLSVNVAGTGGLTKSGTGELILDAANSYSGGLIVNDGRLSVTHPGAIPSGQNVQLVAATSNLLFGGDNGFFVNNGSTGGGYVGGTVNGVISGAGSVIVDLGATATWSGANTFSGPLTVQGTDTVLTLSGSGTPGASDGTAATETRIGGVAQVALVGKAIGNEVLKLNERADASTPAHLTTSGTSSWAGNIKADTPGEGSHYKIAATTGTLTLSGTISAPDAATDQRNFVFDAGGTSNINVTGRITDVATDANGNPIDEVNNGTMIPPGDGIPDTDAGPNVNVIKRGTGTMTISTATGNNFDYHKGSTTIEQGTLRVQGNGGGLGELLSSSIIVNSGAVFDITNFGSGGAAYSQQTGQTIGGAGTINTNGATLALFGDGNLAPGDSIGTLTINGATTLDRSFGGGTLDYELGNTSAEGDRIQINNTFTTTAGTQAMTVNVTPVEGTLQGGGANYVLVSHNVGSAANVTGITAQAVNNLGEVLNTRHTFAVNSTTSQVRLQVNGAQSNLTWAGTVGNNTWDVATSTNWSGSNQFRDLDTVTFGSGGEKNVVLGTNVTPGSTTFSTANTYTFTGSGGITGYGPINVNAGTVRLQNTGNNFAGTTTVANGATLEMLSASTGGMTINGTLSLGKEPSSTLIDDFTGGLGSYSNTVILDTDFPGGVNTAAWQIASEAAQYNTTVYQSIEQTAFIRSGLSLGVGEELQMDVTHTAASQDIGLYVGGTAPTPVSGADNDTRQDYVSVYARDNGQVFSRGFDGTTEYGLVGGASPAYTSLFVARVDENTFETGYYDASGRNVVATRNPTTANTADVVGLYTDVRAAGVLGNADNLRIVELGGLGILDVDGDFTLGATGTLQLDLTVSGVDSLDITGTATLTGEIAVAVEEGLTPADGAQFTILSAAGGIGTLLGNLNFGAGLPDGFTASYNDAMTDLILTFSAGLDGDFNGDGVVNIADYTRYRDNVGAAEGDLLAGNGTGGIIDGDDYNLWKENFGDTAGAGAINSIVATQAAVPEPSSVILLAGLVVSGAWASGRRGIGQHSTV